MTLSEMLHATGPCYGNNCDADTHLEQARTLEALGVRVVSDEMAVVNEPLLTNAASDLGFGVYWNVVGEDENTRVFDFSRWATDMIARLK